MEETSKKIWRSLKPSRLHWFILTQCKCHCLSQFNLPQTSCYGHLRPNLHDFASILPARLTECSCYRSMIFYICWIATILSYADLESERSYDMSLLICGHLGVPTSRTFSKKKGLGVFDHPVEFFSKTKPREKRGGCPPKSKKRKKKTKSM